MSQEMYEVEEIVGMKLLDGKRMFRIKWVGYPSCQNTWEPEGHLQSDLVRSYLKNQDNKKHKLKSPPVVTPHVVNSEKMSSIKDKGKNSIPNERQCFKIISIYENPDEGLIFNVVFKGIRKALPY